MSKVRRVAPGPIMLEGEETSSIHIDTSAIPDYVQDRLAAATLGMIRDILRQPGGRAALDTRKAARAER